MSGLVRNIANARVRGASTLGGVAAQLDTGTIGYKVAPFLSKIKTKAAGSRVLVTGTSIASFDASAAQIIGHLLRRQHGANGTRIINMGAYGGTYGPAGGRKKQVYGGPSFYRMAMEPGAVDLVVSGYVDSLRLVYGKEADGAAFDVHIDGVLDSTLTSNGAQAYEQVYEKAFAARGLHTITIKAPAAGAAYLERVELVQSGAGVFIENAALGGSGLWNTRSLMVDGNAGNRAGVAIVGDVGTDAHVLRAAATAPDLVICQHFTNDVGNVATFTTALARLVADCKTAGIPLVLLSEQPALGYVNAPGGSLTTAAQQVLDAILSYRDESHVTVIDWTAMVDYRDKAAYEARYFPGADKTHPANDGHALPMQAMCDVFGVPHPARISASAAAAENDRPSFVALPATPTDDAYAARYVKPGDVIAVPGDGIHARRRQVVGRSRNFSSAGVEAAVCFAEDVPNLVTSAYAAAISGSATSDAAGPYLRCVADGTVAVVSLQRATSVEQEVTVLLLAKWTGAGSPNLKLNTPSTNAVPRVVVNGSAAGNETGLIVCDLSMPRDAPTLVHLTFKHNAGSNPMVPMSIQASNLDVYGAWVTEGSAPVITARNIDVYRQVGFPLYMTGDAVPANVVPGQVYLEAINGITLEKLALDSVCWKPLQAAFGRVYELRNKGAAFCARVDLIGAATLAYRDKTGGEGYDAATQWQLAGAFGAFPTAKRFTFGVRCPSSANTGVGFKVAFFNGASNTYVYLKADGTWATQAGGNSGTFPVIAVGSNFADGLNVALTFDMPDGSFAAALGANPAFNVYPFGAGSKYHAPAVLCEGSSAVVRWTA